jgi:hypothetical protein
LKISCFKFFFIQNFPPLSLNRINSWQINPYFSEYLVLYNCV